MIVPLLGAFELGLIPTKISSTVTCFLGKPEAMTMTYGYLTQLRQEVRNALHAGLGIEETMKIVTMPEYKHLKIFETLHRSNVEAAYRTLEWEQ
jgi:hypothetical protein